MSIARQVAKAEAVADVSVISALRDISDQLGRAEKEGLRLIPIKATCPWVLDAIWKIASGRVPLEQGSTSIAQGLVTDRANLMNSVISFGNEFSPDGLGASTQRIALDEGMQWGELQSLVDEGASFLTER